MGYNHDYPPHLFLAAPLPTINFSLDHTMVTASSSLELKQRCEFSKVSGR